MILLSSHVCLEPADILSVSVNSIKPSPTISITTKARALKQSGKDLVSLSIGESDFDTPMHIKDAAIEAINAGDTRYTAVEGTEALKDAIIAKLKRDNNLTYTRDRIIASCGAKHSLYNLFVATINPGDEIVIPIPYWVSYPDMIKICGGIPVIVGCNEKFKLTPDILENAITDKTKWLVLNSPSNPSGAVYTEAELAALMDVVRRHPNIYVVSDEIYEHIRYDVAFCSPANAAPDLKDRIVIVNGVAKAYAMTGWRIGFAAGPADIIKAMAKIQSQSTSCPSSISQAAAVEAFIGDQSFLADCVNIFKSRRDLSLAKLAEIDGIECTLDPDGTFYIFANCAALDGKTTPSGGKIRSDMDFTAYLLEEALVGVVPGSAFGLDWHIRISYAVSEEDLIKAFNRIKTACERLSD